MTDPIHILLVDDEPDAAQTTAHHLEHITDAITVTTTTSPANAHTHLKNREIDCIVSDYDMPDQTGIELLQDIRDTHPELPFILYTAAGSQEILSDAISAGVTDYLQKQPGTDQYALLVNRVENAVAQVRAERQVEYKDQQFRQLFEQAPIMYVLVRDVDGWPIIEDCNDRFIEKLGYDREEIIGRPTTDFFTPEATKAVYENGAFERAKAGEFDIEDRTLITKDGDQIETVLRASPRLDDHGDVIGVQTLYLDITERKRREQALQAARDRFELVTQHVDEVILITKGLVSHPTADSDELIDAEIEFVSPEFETIWGRSVDEVYADPSVISAGIHPDDRAEYEAHMERMARDAERGDPEPRYAFDCRVQQPDGETRWISTSTILVPYDDEPRYRWLSTIRDITARKERELELERYERILAASGDAVYTLNPAGQLTFVNEAFCDLVGYNEDELVGEFVSIVMDEEDIERGETLIEEMLASGTDHATWEMDLIRADGDRVRCETHMAILRGGDDEPDDFRGTTGIHRDITERKERERELEEKNERLEKFASIVSHDLRTPLTVAKGHLELAQADCESEHLEQVASAHDRMQSLTEDLLVLAREGDAVRDPEPVDLERVAAECWQTVATADATLKVNADNNVVADESRLRQVFANLFENAVEYGGPDVEIWVGDLPDGFFVADTGPGIPETDRESVFEYGYSTDAEGTGVGLSIVKEVAAAHGWDVSVTESEAGGARFEFTSVETA